MIFFFIYNNMYTWNDKQHSVGIKEIDEQHKVLFDIINDIYICIINKNYSILDKLLLKIIVYTTNHFKTENEYLLKLSENITSDLKQFVIAHITKHETFVDILTKKIEDYILYDKMILIDIAIFLNAWVNNHVISEDVVMFNLLKI